MISSLSSSSHLQAWCDLDSLRLCGHGTKRLGDVVKGHSCCLSKAPEHETGWRPKFSSWVTSMRAARKNKISTDMLIRPCRSALKCTNLKVLNSWLFSGSKSTAYFILLPLTFIKMDSKLIDQWASKDQYAIYWCRNLHLSLGYVNRAKW